MGAEDQARRRSSAPSKGDRREQTILDVTEDLLASKGFDAMTMADIARDAGLSRGSMYFYFGSKHDVVVALVARAVESLREKSRAAAEDPAEPRRAIETAMRRTRAIWLEHGLVMRVAIDLATTMPGVEALWSETADIFTDAIATTLERAGAPPGPHGVAATARALCWMIERSFYQASRDPSPDALDAAADTCQDIWLTVAGLR